MRVPYLTHDLLINAGTDSDSVGGRNLGVVVRFFGIIKRATLVGF